MAHVSGDELRLIFNAIDSGKCMAFLGAGACTEFEDHNRKKVPGLPSGAELAKALAAKCHSLNGKEYDLMTAAEYFLYEHAGDRQQLERFIKQQIQDICAPRPIHTALAQLKQVKLIITTNYDTLMEDELKKYHRNLFLHVHEKDNPRTGHYNEPGISLEENDVVLHKMHGSIDRPGTLIISRSDYVKYLAYWNDFDHGMPEYFRKHTLPKCILLFLGYSLEDWDFQVIWEGLLATYANCEELRKHSFAVIRSASPLQRDYWAMRSVNIKEYDLTDFAKALAEKYNLVIPQLNITRKPQGGAS